MALEEAEHGYFDESSDGEDNDEKKAMKEDRYSMPLDIDIEAIR